MLLEKLDLQEKFITLPNVQIGSLLRFKSDGTLEAVNDGGQGIMPQIKVIANSDSAVSCTKSNGSVVSKSALYPSNTWYFNVPGFGTYTITVISGTTTTRQEVTISEYKQYIVNAIS